MDFETLKEQFLERFEQYRSQVVESELYIRGKETYDTLNPNVQTGLKVFSIVFLVYFFYSIPASFVSSASEKMSFFDENRELTRDLLRAGRVAKNLKVPPPAPSSAILTSKIEGFLNEEQILPEQKGKIAPKPNVANTKLVPKGITQDGVKASINKLNLNQVVRLAESIDRINGSHLMNLAIQADSEDPHFFSVDYEVASFSLPASNPIATEDKGKNKNKKKKSKFKKRK